MVDAGISRYDYRFESCPDYKPNPKGVNKRSLC